VIVDGATLSSGNTGSTATTSQVRVNSNADYQDSKKST
jgi:hypothetical protein